MNEDPPISKFEKLVEDLEFNEITPLFITGLTKVDKATLRAKTGPLSSLINKEAPFSTSNPPKKEQRVVPRIAQVAPE